MGIPMKSHPMTMKLLKIIINKTSLCKFVGFFVCAMMGRFVSESYKINSFIICNSNLGELH